jgi:hypothetical protein
MRSPAFRAVENETYHNAPQTVAKPDSGGVGGKSWAPIRSRCVHSALLSGDFAQSANYRLLFSLRSMALCAHI